MFVTELPQDTFGNRAYTQSQARVIEVTSTQGRNRATSFNVVAPPDFKQRCVTVQSNVFVQVDGPVRLLTEQQWVDLLRQANVDQRIITWAEKRIGK